MHPQIYSLIMITYYEAVEIADKIENSNIDVKGTIEKAVKAGYLGEDQFYATVIKDESFTYPVDRLIDDNYPRINLDNFYFDIISKALDDEGIYISLAYCTPVDESCDAEDIVEYDDYELDSEDLFYMTSYMLLTSDEKKIFKIYEEEGICAHRPTEDIGLAVKYADGKYKSYLALRSADLCMSALRIYRLRRDLPVEHELSLRNPFNRLLVEMIDKTLLLLD